MERDTRRCAGRLGSCGILATACFGGTALAQLAPEARVDYTWTWSEVDRVTGAPSAATPGQIDPSEAVRLNLAAAFSPAVGATVAYLNGPPPGVGTVAGWAGTLFALRGSGGTVGTFTNFEVAPAFSLFKVLPDPDGLAFVPVQCLGIYLSSGPINTTNPVASLISFTWFPADYSFRSVSFSSQNGPAPHANMIGVHTGTGPGGEPTYTPVQVGATNHGPGTGPIPIIPAPATAALGLTYLVAYRRQRRHISY